MNAKHFTSKRLNPQQPHLPTCKTYSCLFTIFFSSEEKSWNYFQGFASENKKKEYLYSQTNLIMFAFRSWGKIRFSLSFSNGKKAFFEKKQFESHAFFSTKHVKINFSLSRKKGFLSMWITLKFFHMLENFIQEKIMHKKRWKKY